MMVVIMRMIYVCISSMVEIQIPVWDKVIGKMNNMWSVVVCSNLIGVYV